jgi:hypothetical protein
LLITLFHNYSEAGFPRPTHLVWFVFLLVVINLKSVQVSSSERMPSPVKVPRLYRQPRRVSVKQITPWLQAGKEALEQSR